jgi:ribosome-binding ATPase YchF (GTP1/OBG family)
MMLSKTTPIVYWVSDRFDNEYQVKARVTEDLLIAYTITDKTGSPTGATSIHADFYRQRPNVATQDWQDDLTSLLQNLQNVTVISAETPKD